MNPLSPSTMRSKQKIEAIQALLKWRLRGKKLTIVLF